MTITYTYVLLLHEHDAYFALQKVQGKDSLTQKDHATPINVSYLSGFPHWPRVCERKIINMHPIKRSSLSMSTKILNNKGFTLIEVMIAITIFAVGLLAIAGLQANAIRHNSGSTLRTTGSALAQGVMEQVLSLESDNPLFRINGTNAATIDPNNGDGDGNTTTLRLQGGGFYTANWVVTVDTPVTRISRIVVNVQEASGRTTTLSGYKRYTN